MKRPVEGVGPAILSSGVVRKVPLPGRPGHARVARGAGSFTHDRRPRVARLRAGSVLGMVGVGWDGGRLLNVDLDVVLLQDQLKGKDVGLLL